MSSGYVLLHRQIHLLMVQAADSVIGFSLGNRRRIEDGLQERSTETSSRCVCVVEMDRERGRD